MDAKATFELFNTERLGYCIVHHQDVVYGYVLMFFHL